MKKNVFVGDTEDAKIGRKWLTELLREQPVETIFTKKDGTERTMKCTLKKEELPEIAGTGKTKNEEVLAVYDLEKEGWRSFRWDSIKEVHFSLGSENA